MSSDPNEINLLNLQNITFKNETMKRKKYKKSLINIKKKVSTLHTYINIIDTLISTILNTIFYKNDDNFTDRLKQTENVAALGLNYINIKILKNLKNTIMHPPSKLRYQGLKNISVERGKLCLSITNNLYIIESYLETFYHFENTIINSDEVTQNLQDYYEENVKIRNIIKNIVNEFKLLHEIS